MTSEFVVYVLFAPKFDQIYIGCTEDLIDRFHSHNALAAKEHTIKYRPWYVFHTEFFDIHSFQLRTKKRANDIALYTVTETQSFTTA